MKDAGHYSDRITLLTHRAVASEDGSGAMLDVWDDDRRVWCRLEDLSGADRVYYGGLQTAVDCKVRCRGNVPVKSADRFRTDDGRTLVINGIHRQDYDIICTCIVLGVGDGQTSSSY